MRVERKCPPGIAKSFFSEKRVISIIYEKDVIQKILEHLNLWEQDLSPPAGGEYIYESYDAK